MAERGTDALGDPATYARASNVLAVCMAPGAIDSLEAHIAEQHASTYWSG